MIKTRIEINITTVGGVDDAELHEAEVLLNIIPQLVQEGMTSGMDSCGANSFAWTLVRENLDDE